MMYGVKVSHSGDVQVFPYKTLQYFLSVAGDAYGVPTHEKNLESIKAAARSQNKFYEVYETDFHAMRAIKCRELPDAAAVVLGGFLKRMQHVAMRAFNAPAGMQ